MSHIRGIILEGYSHAGKTSVLKALKLLHAQEKSAERSVVVLSEHYSQVLNNVRGELRRLHRDDHLRLLQERVSMLRQLSDWADYLGPDASRASRGLFFILERFHLNHRAAYPDEPPREIESLESDLLRLGANCVLLTVSSERIAQRMQSRTPEEWKNKTEEEIGRSADEFRQTQSELRKQARLSIVPTLEINTDAKDWNAYANQIMALSGMQ
ncbi:hypothetical protein [Paenibacillus glycinis]|uniref:Thymidylate kinase n=1 Tax=Paenibacillus glycinis TaxID=2697035 RepID=A0ABW9XPK7_9BACL|nr:hypothetical protein [Paenibacillus glycinis]NBD24578.1 hypothetical protein [Paenibacillus glycinis]